MLVHALVLEPALEQQVSTETPVYVLDQRVPGRLRVGVVDDVCGASLCLHMQARQDVFGAYWCPASQSLLLQFHPGLPHQQLIDYISHSLAQPAANRRESTGDLCNWQQPVVDMEQAQSVTDKTLTILTELAYNDRIKPYQAWGVFHQLARHQLQTSLNLAQIKQLLLHSIRPDSLQAVCHSIRQRLLILEQPCRVKRQSKELHLCWKDICLGDLVYFEVGDRLAVDARLLDSRGLSVDENLATGFVQSSPKQHQYNLSDTLPVDDRSNMVWAGSDVLSGSGCALVTARGLQTQMFKLLAQQMLGDSF